MNKNLLENPTTSTQVIQLSTALEQAGLENSYQKKLVLIISFHALCLGIALVGLQLSLHPVYYVCEQSPENICDATLTKCLSEDIKGQIDYQKTYNSYILQFKLYCENSQKRAYVYSMFFMAKGISAILLSILSDNLGRKTVIVGCFSCMLISFIFLGFLCENYTCLVIGYALGGFGFSAVIGVEITLALETMTQRFKDISIGIIFTFFITGQMLTNSMTYLINNSVNMIQYFHVIPFSLALISLIFIYESPKILIAKGQYDKAKLVIQGIAKYNNRELGDFELSESIQGKQNTEIQNYNKKIYTYYDLIRYKSLRYTVVLLVIIGFSFDFIYDGIYTALQTFEGGVRLNIYIASLGDIIACFFVAVFVKKLQRKKTFQILLLLNSIACLIYTLIKIPQNCFKNIIECPQRLMLIVLVFFSRIIVCMAHALIMIYVSELIPTRVRMLGVGAIVGISRMGSAAAPLVVTFAKKSFNINPISIFGVVSLITLFVFFPLKETLNSTLPDCIQEEDYIQTQYENQIKINNMQEENTNFAEK